MFLIRRGAGPLHIASEYSGRLITKCGSSYRSEDVTAFRSKAAMTAVSKNWKRKCASCMQ